MDVAGLVSFLAGFEVSLAKLLVQLNYIESQFATIEDYQKAIKKAADSFITGIAKVTKTCRDNQDKGKKVWKDALDKEYNDQKTAGDKVKKALLANANVDQFAAANAAITKLNAFYSEFALSVYATDAGFLLMLSGQYDYALQVEMDLSNYESPMIIDHVTLIGQSLFQNVNGKGQSCLKNMTEQFTSTFKSFEAMQGSCFEDLTTYLAFSTEFVTTQLPLVKCQGTGVVNNLPSCLKQVSKKTSKTYADAMYNTCLANVSTFK